MKKQEQIDALRIRIERIEAHLAEHHKGANFSGLNKPEAPEASANKCAPNEGHLREHIDNFFNGSYDEYMEAIEKKIVSEFGEDADISKKFKVMRNTYDLRNLKASIKPDYIPDWKDAPEDAVCVAMDKDGRWYWYKNVPDVSFETFIGKWINKFPDTAANADLLPPDYWKSTLMMRPEAVEPDYSHLLPEGYEFCQEENAEKWVKVEMKNDTALTQHKIGRITECFATIFKPCYRPIRKIQYRVTTHEIVDAVPDPYMPDWSKAPEGAVAHAWDEDGKGYWYLIGQGIWKFWHQHKPSPHTLPPDLDWKQSLRFRPSK